MHRGEGMSAWIKMIEDDEATTELNEVLEMARTPHGTVDNVMRVHSLRPSTMKGHIYLYKSVLHDDSNTIPEWFQETISSYVSILNECEYSLSNHWANAKHLINDNKKSEKIKTVKMFPAKSFHKILRLLPFSTNLFFPQTTKQY